MSDAVIKMGEDRINDPTERRGPVVSERKTTPTGRGLSGRWVELRPVRPDDYPVLYELETGTQQRLRGATPSFQEYQELLWRNVLAQFVVCGGNGRRIGLMAAYAPDMQNGHCRLLSLTISPARIGSALMAEGGALFLNYLFTNWPMRKIYFDSDGPSRLPGVRRGYFVEEARLVRHSFTEGRYVDRHTYALYRETWEAKLRQLELLGSNR